jgi:hypothetical protein
MPRLLIRPYALRKQRAWRSKPSIVNYRRFSSAQTVEAGPSGTLGGKGFPSVLVVMKAHAGPADIARVCERIEMLGLQPHIIPGEQRTAIGITGNRGPIDPAEFEHLPAVAEAIRVSKPYKLVSRETKPENTIVTVNGVAVGGEKIVLCGGP